MASRPGNNIAAVQSPELTFVPRPDVGVNVIRAAQHEPIPSLDYLSKLDCFHPSLKAHSMMAHATWNSMLGASEGPLSFKNNTNFVPACAAPNTSLRRSDGVHSCGVGHWAESPGCSIMRVDRDASVFCTTKCSWGGHNILSPYRGICLIANYV